MRRIILTSSLLLAICSPVIAAEIFQWHDAQGQPHFGSQPPDGVDAIPVSTYSTTPAPSSKPAESAPADTTADDSQKAIDAKVKQDVAKQEAEIKKYCDSLKTNLAQIEYNPRVSVEENGEVRRLTEKERQQRISETQKSIKENCQ